VDRLVCGSLCLAELGFCSKFEPVKSSLRRVGVSAAAGNKAAARVLRETRTDKMNEAAEAVSMS
jgi:hypothetical protein